MNMQLVKTFFNKMYTSYASLHAKGTVQGENPTEIVNDKGNKRSIDFFNILRPRAHV